MISRIGSRAVIHRHGWHGHVCCAFCTGPSSHTVQTRSTWQSLCVFLESVGFGCHADAYDLYLIVRAHSTVFQVSSLPVTTESKRVADPQFIDSRLQNLSLSPPVRTRMLVTAELEKNPTSGKRSYTNAGVLGESGCRVLMMKHWYAQKKNFWTKHSSLRRKLVACQQTRWQRKYASTKCWLGAEMFSHLDAAGNRHPNWTENQGQPP